MIAERAAALVAANRARFDAYYAELVKQNEKMNLTAITARDEVFVRHFEDSLTLPAALDMPQGASLIDIGAGAGFPGLAAAVARDDLEVTLLDSTRKRVDFLQSTAALLGVKVNCVWARAEDAAHDPSLRGRFDFAAARAVVRLPLLVEYAAPFLREGGVFAAMKGPSPEEEVASAENALKKLGAAVDDILHFELSDGSGRSIILIKKISPTATIYPRPSAKISKNPL